MSVNSEELTREFLDDTKISLIEKLSIYGHSDYVPFHMPGHKRRLDDPDLAEEIPWGIDITEIEGFDNLHHAEGILKASMDAATAFYGTKKTYYCINGSTGGILSAILAVTNHGDTVLMGRNCHKSAYHAVFLHGLRPEYIYPQIDEETGIGCGYLPETIRAMLMKNPEIKAVFITSPTYEGVVSDIRRIAEIVHEYGIPLIVDEAHGAHFTVRGHEEEGYPSCFPISSVRQGADIVIQSLHKTLPSLTQTAIVHVMGELVDEGRVQMYLGMFQTSSPSYVLMASIDACMRFMMSERGIQKRIAYEERLGRFRGKIRASQGFHLLESFPVNEQAGYAQNNSEEVFWQMDPSKIPVSCDFMSGRRFYDRLLEEYHIQCEMCTDTYVLLMTSMFDTDEMYRRFLDAIADMQREHAQERYNQKGHNQERETDGLSGERDFPVPEAVYTPQAADQMDREEILLENSDGSISAEYAYLYPPGIPLLVPGERIGREVLEYLQEERRKGFVIEGLRDAEGIKIQVLKE